MLLDDAEHTYIYGAGITPIAQVDTAGKVEYLYSDNIGSVRTLADDTGDPTGTTDYDAYGAQVGTTGTSTSEIGYTGAWTDIVSKLVYLRARDYDAGTAQFLTVDPIVSTTRQPYVYTGNNPLSATDPTGLCSPSDWGCRVVGDVSDPGQNLNNDLSRFFRTVFFG